MGSVDKFLMSPCRMIDKLSPVSIMKENLFVSDIAGICKNGRVGVYVCVRGSPSSAQCFLFDLELWKMDANLSVVLSLFLLSGHLHQC